MCFVEQWFSWEAKFMFVRTMRFVCLFLSLLSVASCATSTALFKRMESIDLGEQSIALLVINTENRVKPSYVPQLNTVRVKGESGAIFTFSVPKGETLSGGKVGQYLLSFRLPAGCYKIHSARGQNWINEAFAEDFVFPINYSFELKSGEFSYIGRIVAVNRERQVNEDRAGEVVVGEAFDSAGFAEGTFDVQVSNRFKQDIKLFKDQYPVLSDKPIVTRMMSLDGPEIENQAVKSQDNVSKNGVNIEEETKATRQKTQSGQNKKKTCSVRQVLGMSELGLSQEQISQVCD